MSPTIVTPEAIMRWHKRLVAMKWTNTTTRTGRPGLTKVIQALIVRMAADNPLVGHSLMNRPR